MSAPPDPDVTAPAEFGPLRLRNRWVLAPMVTLFPEVADDPTEHHVAFYARRARGGVGLVMVGATYVSHDGKGFPNQMGLDRDERTPAFANLATAVQRHAPAVLQLFHAGPKTSRGVSGTQPVAPSAGPSQRQRYDPARMLADAEVSALIDQFADAAARAHHAGFAGVAIHGANGYLVHCFTDAGRNRRGGRWGDPDAFVRELVQRIRARVPPTFLLGYTISPFSAGARDVPDATSRARFEGLAAMLVKAGVDYFHIYRGKQEPTAPEAFAPWLRDSGLTLPIIEGAGVRSVADANAFLHRGATLVATARALLVDPRVPTGHEERSAASLEAVSTSEGALTAFREEYDANASMPTTAS